MAENGVDGDRVSTREANAARDSGDAKGRALAEASDAAEGGVIGRLAALAERVGAHAGVTAVFGDPVERDGRTIIPVAQSMWGSGAGSGGDDEGTGSGAGGGAMTRPLGYIEITGHDAGYVPLQRPWQDARLVIAWALAIWLVSRALNRIIRG